jgi:Flp pilus assembly protein TadB
MRWRARIDRMTQQRRDRMRAELYTIAQLLALQLRAGTTPIVAIRELVDRGGGAVSDDLADVLDAIDHGATTRAALERLATDTPEPAAARLYRTLAAAETGSGDTLTDALLKTADDLRSQRREDVERLATRRRFQMLVPTVVVMGPVMLLLLGAPIPTFIFGD